MGSVIENNVNHQVHFFCTHFLLQSFKICQGTKAFIYFSKIRYGIAPIAFASRTLHYRHQVQKINAKFFKIIQFASHIFEAAAKPVHIQTHANNFIA